MINKDCFFKPAGLVGFTLFALLQPHTVLADPQQRLIIQFDTPLSAAQQQTLTLQIQAIMQSSFSVLPHSTDQRWIIVIDPPIDKANLEKTNAQISRLEHIQYVEPDQMMNTLQK